MTQVSAHFLPTAGRPAGALRRLARSWWAAREIEAYRPRSTRERELRRHELEMAHWHLLLRR
jgi:hypothetical protein